MKKFLTYVSLAVILFACVFGAVTFFDYLLLL